MSKRAESALARLVKAIAQRCAENQNEIVTLRTLLNAKQIIGKREFDDTLAIAREARREILERAGKPDSESLEELLRKYEGCDYFATTPEKFGNNLGTTTNT